MGKEKMVKKNAYDRIWEKASGLYLSHRKLMDILFVALLFVILFFVRVNNINVKNQLHSDEVFSLMLSTCNNYYNQSIPDGDYTGADLKRMITADNEGGIDGAFSDIAQLWHNNGDAPHASLYYMVLRFALIGFDSFNVHSLSWRGGALNLVFFAISFLLMYKLLRRLFGDNILLVLAGLAIAFGNWMSIRNTMLIREYQMAESGIIMLTLIGVALVQTIRANGFVDKKRLLLFLSLVTAYVISLGYFNAVYVLLFGVGIMLSCYKNKRKDVIWILLLSGIVAVVMAWIIYPGFFNFLLHDSVHKEKAFSSVKNIFRYLFVRDLSFQFFTVYGVFIMAFVTLLVLLSKKRMHLFKSERFHWIPVVTLACMVFIQYASVLKMPRYYYALMPMMSLAVPQVIACVPKSWKGYFELLVIFYFPIITLMFPVRENYGWAALKGNLQHPSILYRLNPNEVVQLVPCMNDTVDYMLSGKEYVDIKKDRTTYVVTKLEIGINNDTIKSGKRLIWGKQIYLYDFNFSGNGK